MKIRAVKIENVRSHVDTRIVFRDGFNCLIGGLGAGKTSVLYAIHFALFGEPLGKGFSYLLREDAGKCKVTLWFEHNGSRYTISRGLRRTGTGIAQDLAVLKLHKDTRLIAERKVSSVREQLVKELGIDEGLFREVMWVQQEKLKELLDMKPRERQRKLDALLGLSDFEEAWSELRSYEGYYKREKELYERSYSLLYDRLNNAMLAKAAELEKLGTSAKLLDPAVPPTKPIKPRRVRMVIMATILGLGIGFGSALLLEYSDRSFRDEEEMSEFLRLPILASLPRLSELE